jgi:hypothetical protein
MNCPTCGHENPPGALFCGRCAKGLHRDPQELRPAPAHVDAGDTEQAAADRIAPKAGTLRAQALTCFQKAGSNGLTDWELHLEMAVRYSTAIPRRYELQHDGWVRDSGSRRATDSGSPAIVWVLADA